MKDVKIVEYEEQYKNTFINISYEWLKKYSLLEPKDILILNHPEETVLENGGHILFAKYDEKVVGTVALMKIDGDTFELAKLSVTEQYQGLKIGSMLIKRCIEIAKKDEAKKIILYTNHELTAAIHLYNRYGFKEIPQEVKKYMEADMKFELYLE